MIPRSPWPTLFQPTASLLILLVAGVSVAPAGAQEGLPEGISSPNKEPSSSETLMERTDLGNVAQTARMRHASGMRDLKKAIKLQERASQSTVPGEKAKLEEKAQQTLESADRAFREALSYSSGLIEAYAGLGTTLRLQGKTQEALEVHALALRRDPEDLENFEGWSESLMALNMLGNATSAYTHYVQTNPTRAEILMTAIEEWLAVKETDPGETDPEDVQRLANWVEQQEQG